MPLSVRSVTPLRLSHSLATASILSFQIGWLYLQISVITSIGLILRHWSSKTIIGDMSLLGGYRDEKEGLQNKDGRSAWFIGVVEDRRSNRLIYQNDDHDLQSNTYGFSWGPKPLVCLKSIGYLEENEEIFRIKPATLSMHGLRVCGVLWNANSKVNVPQREENLHQDGKRGLHIRTVGVCLTAVSEKNP